MSLLVVDEAGVVPKPHPQVTEEGLLACVNNGMLQPVGALGRNPATLVTGMGWGWAAQAHGSCGHTGCKSRVVTSMGM